MNRYSLAALMGLMLACASAQAVEMSGQVGKHFRGVTVGLGTTTPGLGVSGSWYGSDHNGSAAGLGLGYGVPVGPVLVTLGGKGLIVDPQHGKNGGAVAIGGGLQWSIMPSLKLFADYYYAPDALSSRIQDYRDISGGVRYNLFMPLDINVGYRYTNISGRNGRQDSTLADGPWVGASLHF